MYMMTSRSAPGFSSHSLGLVPIRVSRGLTSAWWVSSRSSLRRRAIRTRKEVCARRVGPRWGNVWSNRQMFIMIIWRGIMCKPNGVERATQVVESKSS